jgi:nucleoside 2-deoxyribosyltransferase
MIAVLIFNDPGTLIEIGIAVERGIPVIVYDPYGLADNLMLTQLPKLVSNDLDAVISATFEQASKL